MNLGNKHDFVKLKESFEYKKWIANSLLLCKSMDATCLLVKSQKG